MKKSELQQIIKEEVSKVLNEETTNTYYHGSDVLVERGDDLKLPLWVTPDISLAQHFALRPAGSSKKVNKGYVYKLELINPTLKKIDLRRFILEKCDSINILEIKVYAPDPITFTKLIQTITPNN